MNQRGLALAMLLFPYVVVISTGTGVHELVVFESLKKEVSRWEVPASDFKIVCNPKYYKCEGLDDLAEALNQAHRRRVGGEVYD